MEAEELLAADKHIAECQVCRERLAEQISIASRIKALRLNLELAAVEPYHPSFENLQTFVDGCADQIDGEILRNHLDHCSSCLAEVGELTSFRDELSKKADLPRASRSGVVGKEARPRRSFPFVPVSRPRILQATALLLVAAASAGITHWLSRRSSGRLTAQIEALSQENTALRHQVDDARIKLDGLAARLAEAKFSRSTPHDSTAKVEIRDGSGISYGGPGNLSVPSSMPASFRELMERALAAGRVNLPAWAKELRGKPDVLMGLNDSADSFKVESPVGSAIVSDRPWFRWKTLKGALSYVVSVYDEQLNQITKSAPLTVNKWRPKTPLKRGVTYTWQVVASKGGNDITAPAPPAPEARFKVIDAATASELETAARNYPEAHLLLGLLYARAGVADDARRELESLSRANPGSPLAKRLLASLATKER